MTKKKLFVIIVTAVFVAIVLTVVFGTNNYEIKNEIQIVEKETLILGNVQDMRVTCYSLVEFSSDGITASGKEVAYGMVASNVLPFGTKVKIEGFGDKVFVVEGRFMTGWTRADLDIYFGDGLNAYKKCVEWGKRDLNVLILQEDAKHIDEINKRLIELTKENSKMTDSQIGLYFSSNKDIFIDSAKALRYGLIDKII